MKWKIGLDVDDVLLPWSQYAHEACEKAGVTGGKVITQWGFHEDYGITSEELWDVLFAAYLDGMLERQAYPGAFETLAEFVDQGHEVTLITSRGFERHKGDDWMAQFVRRSTQDWLMDNNAVYHDLVFTKDKSRYDFDWFLDDNPGHVVAQMARGTQAYLNDQPHNQGVDLPRVRGIVDFANMLNTETQLMRGVQFT